MDQGQQFEYRKKELRLSRVFTVALMSAAAVVILFPLLLRARARMVDGVCAANLRQIGQALVLYSADFDAKFPAACDASDKVMPQLWAKVPRQAAQIKKFPMLQVPLKPYVKKPSVFKCPLDNGGTVMDNTFGNGLSPFISAPTMYANYGSSYLYRTEITFQSLKQKGFWPSADVAVLFDGYGHWHGRTQPIATDMNFRRTASLIGDYRYNALFGDGHVSYLTYSELQATWNQKL